LYLSKNFLRAAIKNLPKPVQVGGVCRNGNRGFPVKLVQKEVTTKGALEAARGTVKVAKTEDGLLAFSLYDEKPVNFA
jgi:hypothetical protein